MSDRVTLSDALANIAAEALPAILADQIAWINAASAILLSGGKWARTTLRWKGTTTDVNFAIFEDQYGGLYFTLPRRLLAVLGGGYGTTPTNPPTSGVSVSATAIRGMWHEFSRQSFGPGDTVQHSGIHDLGSGFTVFRDFTADSYLKVVTETSEATGAEILFRGLDANNEEIFTGIGAARYQGVTLDISTALSTQTSQIFSGPRPTLIVKPVTRGAIRLYAVDASTAVETLIAFFEPGEKLPSYRRYGMAPCANAVTVHALCSRKFVPAVVDEDEVIPANIQALELALIARKFDLTHDQKSAFEYWSRAFSLLNAELEQYTGSMSPKLQFEPGFSLAGHANIH